MTYGTLSDFLGSESPVREYLSRSVTRLAGCLVMVLSVASLASLITWHADDPSFSFSADIPAANILGFPGAAFADLAMQFLGLGAIGFVLPMAIFGWNLFRLRVPRRPLRQAFSWIAGMLALSGALACFPIVGQWPLPTGLGGALGDLVLRIPETVVGGELSGGLYAALAVVLGGLSLGFLGAACLRRKVVEEAAPRRKAKKRRAPAAAEVEDEEEVEKRPSRLLRLAGLLWRGILALFGLTRRAVAARRRHHIEVHARAKALEGERREPRFAGGESFDAGEEPEEVEDEDEADEEEPEPTHSRIRPAPSRRKPKVIVAASSDEFELPPLELLTAPAQRRREPAVDHAALEQNARLLEGILDDFGVRGDIINVRPGPVVTLYELEPAPGIKSSRVISLADDIARSMSAIAARVAVIPGKNAIGIELPNATRETVLLRELVASGDFQNSKGRLALALGKTIGGEPVIADLTKMPHLLVAGTTGSGKSVSINTMILSLLYRLTPAECRLIMIDPKMLELSVYDGIPHLLAPVVTDPKKAIVALKWTVREMEDRYKKMSKLGVRNIDGFNQRIALAEKKGEVITRTVQTGFDHESGDPVFETEELELEPMPFIVVIIDEMADLMMVAGKEIEGAVQRLAQMARAAGIHVVMATQRPSVDVITGTIKANFPTRISFQVTSKIDSRTILGEQGAEQLLGQGDMLYMMGGGRITRVHGPFVADGEVENIVAHLKAQGVPDYLDAITEEDSTEDGGGFDSIAGLDESNDLYDQAVAVVLRDRKASTSYIQRRLSIGYNRAASLIERMEKEGVVGSANHAGKREILVGEDAA